MKSYKGKSNNVQRTRGANRTENSPHKHEASQGIVATGMIAC